MFNAAASFLAVTLAISTIVSPASDARGASIPLPAAAAAAINKHSQNLKNLVNNIGAIALPKSRATILRDVEERLQRRQAETLTDVNGDELWASSISIGTPAQQFVIGFETGSSDLCQWLPSVACATCTASNSYNSLDSSTAKQQTGAFQIQYGDDSEVSGLVFTDTVSVAGVKATN